MASTSKLTIYTKAAPVPYGPLTLAAYIEEAAGTEGVITLDYAEKATEPTETCRLESGGSSTTGPIAIVKSLAAAYASVGICGRDQTESAQVDKWIAFTDKLSQKPDFQGISAAADELDRHLTLRSFLVGYKPTAADFALWGTLKSSTVFLGLAKRGLHPHLGRWYTYIESLPAVQKGIAAYLAAQKEKAKGRTENATFELGLEGAVRGQVVTRLPPEPSGYLHIGHAKAAILNQHFARMYDGKFIVRYDDTNPSKEKEEFQQAIIEDLALMGIVGDKVSYTSDYFDHIYQLAVQMIKTDKAYADDTEQMKMRDERMNGIASARRDASVEENLARFADMTSGSEQGTKWCLRAKISFDNPNKAMRDPVIYRCNLQPHHKTGDTWKVYPTYDFACPVVDSLEGVTHALRTNEYHDRNPQYWWMQEALSIRKVDIWDYGRINFVYTLLSKRKLKAMVEEKCLVEGWDDPRFPTVRGIRRRGLTIEALKQYMLAQGPSQATTSLEWDGIWAMNKRVVDPVAPRYTAVAKKDIVEVTVTDAAGKPVVESAVAVPKHKKNLDIGNKTTVFAPKMYIEQVDAASFAPNEEVTFMDWGNAYTLKSPSAETPLEALDVQLHLEGDFKKTSKKVHWLAISAEKPLVNVILKDYDYLITKKKIEEDDQWEDFINPTTEFREEAFADNNVSELKQGDIIQFERKGYYICDKALDGPDGVMEFIFIPDGKASSVALKAKSADAAKPAKKAPAGKAAAAAAATAAATAPPAKGQTSKSQGQPELAPQEPTSAVLDSRGLQIPVKTKMYRVDSLTGDYEPEAQTKMHPVPSLTTN